MNRYEYHLHDARDTALPPVVVSAKLWNLLIVAARANGAQDFERVFSPFDAKRFAGAIKQAMAAPPASAPSRSHVPAFVRPVNYAAALNEEARTVGAVIALFERGGVMVERATARELHAVPG